MIFNINKTVEEYSNVTLFGNSDEGVALVDTINRRFDKIWDLYKEMKVLDWSEDEFDHSQTLIDFKKVHSDVSDIMIEQLAFQWETDSVATQVPFALISPYKPCSEIIAAELRINDNETIHSATYSEIVKMSFEDPKEVLKTMTNLRHTHELLGVVGRVLADLQKKSAALNYFGPDHFTDLEKVEHMLLFYFVMYIIERLQFMSSFGVTFTICQSGVFQSIGNAIKKICQDEFEVHCEYRLEVIKQILSTPEGKLAFENLRPLMIEVLVDVINAQQKFSNDIFRNGTRSITGLNSDLLFKWALYNAGPIATNFGFTEDEIGFELPKDNPLPHMDNWIDINKSQQANQETNNTAYKVNVIDYNDATVIYNF